MTVKLIKGMAFTGKTRKCINEIKMALKNDCNVLFINPCTKCRLKEFKMINSGLLVTDEGTENDLDELLVKYNNFEDFDVVVIDDFSLLHRAHTKMPFKEFMESKILELTERFEEIEKLIIISVIIGRNR